MGQVVHDVLHDLFDKLTPQQRTYEKAESILNLKWIAKKAGFKDENVEQQYKLKAVMQLRQFISSHELSTQPFRLERNHEIPLAPDLILQGRVDRIDSLSDSSFHILDYKTGGADKKPDEKQLLLYSLIVTQNFKRKVSKASYLYLEDNNPFDIVPDDQQMKSAMEEVKRIAREITEEHDFQPSVSGLCKFCDFLEICDEGKNHCIR
jgi:ATP-dependent helicase/DNAse subunit B